MPTSRNVGIYNATKASTGPSEASHHRSTRSAATIDVAASVPGVRLTGQITDAVGRTGTAVERDGQTYVIAASNGQLLADIEAGVTYTYVSQEPATTAPGLDGK